MKVVELRAELRMRELETVGRASALIRRLQEADSHEATYLKTPSRDSSFRARRIPDHKVAERAEPVSLKGMLSP